MRSAKLFLIYLLFLLLPQTRLFRLKATLLRFAGISLGRNVRITSTARFYVGGALRIGDNTWIGEDVLITGGQADVEIGENCDIGPRVTIATGTHVLWETDERAAGFGLSLPIQIGKGVWIGANATVLGGVTVGDCAMIAAGAVVVSDIEPHTMVGGVPAKMVRMASRTNNSVPIQEFRDASDG